MSPIALRTHSSSLNGSHASVCTGETRVTELEAIEICCQLMMVTVSSKAQWDWPRLEPGVLPLRADSRRAGQPSRYQSGALSSTHRARGVAGGWCAVQLDARRWNWRGAPPAVKPHDSRPCTLKIHSNQERGSTTIDQRQTHLSSRPPFFPLLFSSLFLPCLVTRLRRRVRPFRQSGHTRTNRQERDRDRRPPREHTRLQRKDHRQGEAHRESRRQ